VKINISIENSPPYKTISLQLDLNENITVNDLLNTLQPFRNKPYFLVTNDGEVLLNTANIIQLILHNHLKYRNLKLIDSLSILSSQPPMNQSESFKGPINSLKRFESDYIPISNSNVNTNLNTLNKTNSPNKFQNRDIQNDMYALEDDGKSNKYKDQENSFNKNYGYNFKPVTNAEEPNNYKVKSNSGEYSTYKETFNSNKGYKDDLNYKQWEPSINSLNSTAEKKKAPLDDVNYEQTNYKEANNYKLADDYPKGKDNFISITDNLYSNNNSEFRYKPEFKVPEERAFTLSEEGSKNKDNLQTGTTYNYSERVKEDISRQRFSSEKRDFRSNANKGNDYFGEQVSSSAIESNIKPTSSNTVTENNKYEKFSNRYMNNINNNPQVTSNYDNYSGSQNIQNLISNQNPINNQNIQNIQNNQNKDFDFKTKVTNMRAQLNNYSNNTSQDNITSNIGSSKGKLSTMRENNNIVILILI
jgi:hypothetical protein